MRICLLTEGSYPYVVGGVSSWVQMLMEGLPEYEFTPLGRKPRTGDTTSTSCRKTAWASRRCSWTKF